MRGKVPVTLGDYENLEVTVAKVEYDEAAIEAKFQQINRPYVLVPVRVAEEGGAQQGRVVVADVTLGAWKKKDCLVDVVLDQKEPWAAVATRIQGMGQMEFKRFDIDMPSGLETFAPGTTTCEVLVKQIYDKQPDGRTDDEKRQIVAEKLRGQAQRLNDQALDTAIRDQLASASFVDTDKIVNSVSWAKFGPRSTADYQWALIQEEIARKEGLDFNNVPAFLRDKARVTWVTKSEQ